MKISEAIQVWSRAGGKNVRKYRCTQGARKGRTMASPAACNRPINISKSRAFKQTKAAKTGKIATITSRTKRVNPTSTRLPNINKLKHLKRKRI